MKLSVVIPLYLTRHTMTACISSVVRNRIDGMEIILVDDGSPDGSAELADAYAGQYDFIKVIHQPNAGLSAARNAGIAHSQGEWITFVDSDDTVGNGTYRYLQHIAGMYADADIIEYPVDKYGRRQPIRAAVYHDARLYWLEGRAYEHTYAWNKWFRRELFHDVRFPVGRVFEDAATLPLLLQHARTVVVTSEGLYHYTLNPNGITQQATGTGLAQLLQAHVQVLSRWHNARYYAHVLNIQLDVYELTHARPVLPVLPYYRGAKLILLHLIGLKRLCQLNCLLHRLRIRRS